MPGASRIEEIDRATRLERRRRVLHMRRRRRDLLEDLGAGLVLMVFALIVTPGLGMLAIIEFPVALVLIATVVMDRRRRRRRRELTAGPAVRRPRRPPAPR